MSYQLIHELSESRAFRTRQKVDELDITEAQDFFYAYLLGLIALAFEPKTSAWAQGYASKTSAFSNFDHFRASGTDLYMLAFKLNENQKSDVTSTRLVFLLRGIAKLSVDHSFIQSYLLRLERHIKIKDSRLKNIRRILPNWATTSISVKINYLNYLKRHILSKNRMSEILPFIDAVIKENSGGTGVGKAAGIIAVSALAGMMLGLNYDPRQTRGFLKPVIGEMMKESSDEPGIFDLVSVLEMNPAVDHVISVDRIEDGLIANVMASDGKVYEFSLKEVESEKNT